MRRAAGRATAPMLVAAMLMGTMPAFAGEIADKAVLAETLLGRGYAEAALGAFDKAGDAFWSASPLQFRVLGFVDSVSGYANYVPRADSVFRNGDTLRLYFEPVGQAFIPDGDGVKAGITVDIELRTPGGLILGSADDFATLEWRGRTAMHEVQGTLESRLPFLKPGDYLLLLTFRDQGSDKTKDVTLPFTVAP